MGEGGIQNVPQKFRRLLRAKKFFLFYSFNKNDQDEVCSNWILLYFLDIGTPLLTMLGVASMVLRGNGKELYREIWFPLLSTVANPPLYHVNT